MILIIEVVKGEKLVGPNNIGMNNDESYLKINVNVHFLFLAFTIPLTLS